MANVFISYSHDSEQHKQRVRQLAEDLRNQHGLDVLIDQHMLPGGPAEGWSHWSEEQVRQASKVLADSRRRGLPPTRSRRSCEHPSTSTLVN